LTVRQLFYRLVVADLIDKTDAEYKNVACRLSGEMRDSGTLPFSWIVDNSRWMRKPQSFSSMEAALDDAAAYYRRDLWQDQDAYVEVWCESDSIAGVIYPETAQWDVPLMVSKGFSSKTFLHDAAVALESQGKPAFLYYAGDYDPSGLWIDQKIIDGIKKYAPDADFTFQRVAVTPEQIEEWKLPSRPPKSKDSRAKKFRGGCVELESLTTEQIRGIIRHSIEGHINQRQLEQSRRIETAERETLALYAERLGAA
jgi:hypothetical protein